MRGVLITALVAALLPAEASAQAEARRFPITTVPDAALLAAALAAAAVPIVAPPRVGRAPCAPCDAARLPWMDRRILGPERRSAGLASDVALGVTTGGAHLALALSRRGASDADERSREDLVLAAEAMALNWAATEWLKLVLRRPRPVLFGPDQDAAAAAAALPDNARSFPSGHTSAAFAAVAAYASILTRRGDARRHAVPIALGVAGATATGVLRVVARKHFPTDVAAGAALGSLIGWILPQVHAARP